MKFALALVASLAQAVKVDDLMDDLEDAVSVTLYDDMTWSADYGWDDYWYEDEYCDNYWNWEDCSYMWWRDACEWEAEGDCGWIYEDYWTWETFWVSCDEFNSWDSCNGGDYWEDEYCDNWWNWEDCSQMYWRDACEWEMEGDCGWIYEYYNYDTWSYDTYWVSCDEFWSWDSCNGDDYWEDEYCYNEWTWEDCSQMWYRSPCEWEIEGDGYGWIYEYYNYDTWSYDTFYVSSEEFYSWEACW